MGVRAAVERFLSPNLGYCYRCERPWKHPVMRRIGPRTWRQLDRDRFFGLVGVVEHITDYGSGGGCFPLCESCWSAMAPCERLPYYDQLVSHWSRLYPDEAVEYERKRDRIRQAVLAGK